MNLNSFAGLTQFALILLMLIGFVMLGQTIRFEYYQIGLIVMVVASLTQIAFGNITPTARFGRTIQLYLLFTACTVAVFAVSIWLAPILVGLGR